jgi:signal transduction histidine kinase
MKNNFTSHPVALHLMVSRVSASSLSAATKKNSFIINDIPVDLHVNTDEHMLATIFGSLLNTVITHTQDCCIRISARLYGKVVLIHIKESSRIQAPAFAGNIRQLQQLAEKRGGTISISSESNEATTIVFSFANAIPLAA